MIGQGKEQIAQLEQQLQIAGEALKSKVDDMQLQREKSAEAANTAIQTAQIKAEADLQAKREAAEISAATERDRIASNERIAIAREFQKAGMGELSVGAVVGETDEQNEIMTPATIVQAITTQGETAAMAQMQSTQALAQMIEQSSAQSTQAVAELATLITQAMTAPKTATLSNGKTITVRTGA